MASTVFKEHIKSLHFALKEGGKESGVILTSEYERFSSKLSPQELFALEIAKEKFDADAVYFRYFNDGRESVPQIYIYDNTDLHLTEKETKNIHKKVWSGCQVLLFILVEKATVKVFDAREKVEDNIKNHAFETIQLTGKAINDFFAKSFDDGLFWEEKNNEKRFQYSNSAYRDLIVGLKNIYTDFQEKSNLSPPLALKLLVQCLLIKYLEERDEQTANGYFAKKYFKNHFQSDNFCEVIRKGKLLDLLDELSVDFNGKIFEWDKKTEQEERQDITNASVRKLAEYLDGNSQNEQLVLWRLYSFSHLPVELISSVYEELLTNSKDIVYTPEMIVSTLIDECMPLKSPKQNFKLIDVSCGSGIFLVKAYKRIIQWWRYEQWLETGELIKPDLTTLKDLLTKSIFGIDIQGDAIRLSVFSLALALLDEVDLSPPVWQKLKFPDLGKNNIIENDFFHFITNKPPNDFDLVIGNPPFNVPDNINKGEYVKKLEVEYGYKSDLKIPKHNLALMFLAESLKIIKSNAILCLIQPSGPLFYQKNEKFRNSLFAKYNLLQVIDLTKLGDVLWGDKNIATAAVFIQNKPPDDEDILHIVVRHSLANSERLFLELDNYDFHTISKEEVCSNPYLWKTNAIGGGRVTQLISRLSNLRTIRDFLNEKKEEGWEWSDGFKIEGKKRVTADYITGKDFLPTNAFTEKGIDWSQVHPCIESKFERPRSYKIYTPPHLLLKAIIGNEKLPAFFTDRYLVFKSKIIGIHAPLKNRQQLLALHNYLLDYSDILRFYITCTGSQQLVNRATAILNEDLMNLPYPEHLSSIKISNAEKILVDDVLKYQLYGDNELLIPATESQLKTFSKTFCQTLNSIYQTSDKAFRPVKMLDAGNYYAIHFEYTKENYKGELEQTNDLEKYIKQCIPTQKSNKKNLHIQRVLKVYSRDTIILTKPKNLRYWIQSIAIRDADETFSDYVKAGF